MTQQTFLLTIDVEDWFQVENFKSCIPFSSWASHEFRVEKNTHRLLDLFDEMTERRLSAAPNDLRCTFFILGWIAERLPHLVREIHSRGHEVASHGCTHELCSSQSPTDCGKDLSDSRKLLEDIIGSPVYGYRAPSFSINDDILKIIQESGYLYDSSYNSFAIHGRYGRISLNGYARSGIAYRVAENFCELPVSNLQFRIQNSKFKLVFPWGGGGYFRLIPFSVFKKGVRRIVNMKSAYVFYMHPWEIDSHQPRVDPANRLYKFRHYANLGSTLRKLSLLITTFKECEFLTCSQYLGEVASSEAALKSVEDGRSSPPNAAAG